VESTPSRHWSIQFSPNLSYDLDEMISHFLVELKSIGITLPFAMDDRRARLEFARHALVAPAFDQQQFSAMSLNIDAVRQSVDRRRSRADSAKHRSNRRRSRTDDARHRSNRHSLRSVILQAPACRRP
jgi:hypothetical protein